MKHRRLSVTAAALIALLHVFHPPNTPAQEYPFQPGHTHDLLKEGVDGKVANYGEEISLRFSGSDLPKM